MVEPGPEPVFPEFRRVLGEVPTLLGVFASSSVLTIGGIFMKTNARGNVRVVGKVFLGACLILGSIPGLSGCGGDSSGTKGVVEVDPAKLKAEQDAMRAAQEQAHKPPAGKR